MSLRSSTGRPARRIPARPDRSRRPAGRGQGRQHRPVKRGRWHPWTALRRAWHSLPLSRRLALITTATLTLGLLVTSLVVTSLLYTHLLGQVDDQLRTTARSIGSQSLAQIRTGNRSVAPSTYYVEAQYTDGSSGVLVSADTAASFGVPQLGTLSLSDAVGSLTTTDQPVISTVASDIPGRPWRVIVLPIVDADQSGYRGVVAIGLPLTDMMETVSRTRLIVGLADACAILLGALAAVYLVHRSFRPLRQIEGVAGQIARGDLSARVPVTEPASTEVGSLQRALNTMLQQNEQAFSVQVVAQERMTRFVSDASHELRTPLAAIRGYGELYRMGGVPPERVSEVMGRIESEAARMGRLVEDLLQLARMDEGRKMTIERVDLTEVCRSALVDMMVLAPDRHCQLLALDASIGDEPVPVHVLGDRDRLSQVITNLLGNVTRHTPAGSPVEIAVGTGPATGPGQAGCAVVEVRDHGPGVPEAEAEKVFRRFYRSDSSRNRETGGSGLGLAIVSAIISRHGGSVRMLTTPGGGATVHIEIPLAAEGPTPDGARRDETARDGM